MGFSKKENSKEIAIKVKHPWHPDSAFIFYFPKQLPETALAAERNFVGLKDDEREDAARLAMIGVVAEMVLREPEGFDDFPGAAEVAELKAVCARLEGEELEADERARLEERQRGLEEALARVRETPLAKRMCDYFDDPAQPELEQIIVSVWRGYKAAAIPAAYLFRPADSGAAGGLPSSEV